MAKKAVKEQLDERDRPDTPHPEYDELRRMRKVVQDIVCGVDELLEDLELYLPQYEGETDESYELRQKNATLNKYTKKAIKVMGGMVFSKEIQFDGTPQAILDILENVDKEGDHVNIFAQQAFEDGVLRDGYGAIVVDTPSTVAPNFKAQATLDTNPFARYYAADAIWNWHYSINPVSQKKELDLIVFQDCIQVKDGRFGVAEQIKYRVYELTDGVVTLETFTVDENNKPVSDGPAKVMPASEITIAVCGKLGDKPPLYDIALKNIEHFRTYSLMKSDAFKTCIPQRVIEGGSTESVAPIAGDVTLFPPMGAKAYFIEVEGKSLEFVRNLCKDIAQDIALMTAAIIGGDVQNPQQKTATEDVIDHTQETAELRPMAEQFKDTLENMLRYFGILLNLGDDAGGSVILGTQWAVAEQQAQQKQQQDMANKVADLNIKDVQAGNPPGTSAAPMMQ